MTEIDEGIAVPLPEHMKRNIEANALPPRKPLSETPKFKQGKRGYGRHRPHGQLIEREPYMLWQRKLNAKLGGRKRRA